MPTSVIFPFGFDLKNTRSPGIRFLVPSDFLNVLSILAYSFSPSLGNFLPRLFFAAYFTSPNESKPCSGFSPPNRNSTPSIVFAKLMKFILDAVIGAFCATVSFCALIKIGNRTAAITHTKKTTFFILFLLNQLLHRMYFFTTKNMIDF